MKTGSFFFECISFYPLSFILKLNCILDSGCYVKEKLSIETSTSKTTITAVTNGSTMMTWDYPSTIGSGNGKKQRQTCKDWSGLSQNLQIFMYMYSYICKHSFSEKLCLNMNYLIYKTCIQTIIR